jgi:hypothetical protein
VLRCGVPTVTYQGLVSINNGRMPSKVEAMAVPDTPSSLKGNQNSDGWKLQTT